ncbi:MAG: DUF1566 domain-containing protein [Thiotrichaceae bacterium]|nr:DUF1566 domain-containing protein [Thiotrichaceae bacterium]
MKLLILLFIATTPTTYAEITVKEVVQGNGAEGTFQLSHELQAGDDRVIMVGVSLEDVNAIGQVTNIQYGGVAMTVVPNSQSSKQTGSYSIATAWYVLLDAALPAIGDQNLSIQHDANDLTVVVMQLEGVDQAQTFQVANHGAANTGSLTTSIMTNTTNNLLIDILGGGHPQSRATFSSTGQSLQQWTANATSSQSIGILRLLPTVGNHSVTYQTAGINRMAHSMLAIAATDSTGGGTGGGNTGMLGISSSASSQLATLTYPHTLGAGEKRVVIVGVEIESAGQAQHASVVQYAGITMHPVPLSYAPITSSSYALSTELFYLEQSELPIAGNHTVSIQHNGLEVTSTTTEVNNVVVDGIYNGLTKTTVSSGSLHLDVNVATEEGLMLSFIAGGKPSPIIQSTSSQNLIANTFANSSHSVMTSREISTIGNYAESWQTSQMNRAALSVVILSAIEGDGNGGGGGTGTEAEVTLGDANGAGGQGGDLSYQHNLSIGENRVIVVGVEIESGSDAGRANNVEYAGIAMNPVPDTYVSAISGSYSISTELFYLEESELPTEGSNTISLQHNGIEATSTAVQLIGIAVGGNYTSLTTTGIAPQSVSLNTDVTMEQGMIISFVGGGNPSPRMQAGVNQNIVTEAMASSSHSLMSSQAITAIGSYTESWQTPQMNRVALSVMILPALSSGSNTTTLVTRDLNDTGIDTCVDDITNANLIDCAQTLLLHQDGAVGRDVDNNDSNDGHVGFAFTKLDATGADLPVIAADWSCIRDNVSGLIWEKKSVAGLHTANDQYAYYNPSRFYPGYEQPEDGIEGFAAGDFLMEELNNNVCDGYDSADSSTFCNTTAYTQRVNDEAYCGISNWRLPDREEMRSIADLFTMSYGVVNIDTNFFPNTIGSTKIWQTSQPPYGKGPGYATSDTALEYPDKSWMVYFDDPEIDHAMTQREVRYVRLVSGNPVDTEATARFVINGSTVKDKQTNLIWKRCVEGYRFDDNDTATNFNDDHCVAENTSAFNYAEALGLTGSTYASQNTWRVPNITELMSVVNVKDIYPAVDSRVFPDLPGTSYSSSANIHWTSSIHTGNHHSGWAVNFWNGGDRVKGMETTYSVRLVRNP